MQLGSKKKKKKNEHVSKAGGSEEAHALKPCVCVAGGL